MDFKDFDQELAMLQQTYEKSIPQKLTSLETFIHKIQEKGDLQDYLELSHHLHKIAGSAGCYGYEKASILCKKMHDEIFQKIKDFSSIDPAWKLSLNSSFQEIKKAFYEKTKIV